MKDSESSQGDWEVPAAFPGRPGPTLHIWLLDVGPGQSADACASLLSPDETERAARLRSADAQRRFVVSRGRLRQILGRYLGLEPADIVFAYGSSGKPRIDGGTASGGATRSPPFVEIPSLAFNLSHSRNLALCALCEEGAVGVDLEGVRPLKDVARLAQRHFSPEEMKRWSTLAPGDRLGGFYRTWTRKEALLKAAGVGLSRPLERVDSDRGRVDDTSYWLTDLDIGSLRGPDEFRAAVAGEREPTEIHCWTWADDERG